MLTRHYVVTATPPEDLADIWGMGPQQYPPEAAETVCKLVEALRACGYEVIVELEGDSGRTIFSAGDRDDVLTGRVPKLTPDMLRAASGPRRTSDGGNYPETPDSSGREGEG